MKASKAIRATATALLCVLCTACAPEGEAIVIGKEIQGKYHDSHTVIIQSLENGRYYEVPATVRGYYSVSVGDTVSVSLGEIVGVHRKQEPEAKTE